MRRNCVVVAAFETWDVRERGGYIGDEKRKSWVGFGVGVGGGDADGHVSELEVECVRVENPHEMGLSHCLRHWAWSGAPCLSVCFSRDSHEFAALI